jgi:hypothetical protein
MPLKTYHGSCHCGAIKYEADIDFDQGTTKCNCTICSKLRWWGARLKPEAFRLNSPSPGSESEVLTDYTISNPEFHQLFCKKCGIHAYHTYNAPLLGGEIVSVNVACLDDFPASEAAVVGVRYSDGRNNNWRNEPEEKRHL